MHCRYTALKWVTANFAALVCSFKESWLCKHLSFNLGKLIPNIVSGRMVSVCVSGPYIWLLCLNCQWLTVCIKILDFAKLPKVQRLTEFCHFKSGDDTIRKKGKDTTAIQIFKDYSTSVHIPSHWIRLWLWHKEKFYLYFLINVLQIATGAK